MYTFKKGDADYHTMLNDNFNEVANYRTTGIDGRALRIADISPQPVTIDDIRQVGTFYITSSEALQLISEDHTLNKVGMRGAGWLTVEPFSTVLGNDCRQIWRRNTDSSPLTSNRILYRKSIGTAPNQSWLQWAEVSTVDPTIPQKLVHKVEGTGEADAIYKAAFDEKNTNMTLIRQGNKVDAYLRVNVLDPNKLKDSNGRRMMPKVFSIPEGYKKSSELSPAWNIPLVMNQYKGVQGNYAALFEMDVQGIRITTDQAGNHYVYGSWYTSDPFTESMLKRERLNGEVF